MIVPALEEPKTKVQSAAVPVLLMVRELDQGGVERDITKIAMHMDRSRYIPHVASFFATGLRYEELRAAQIPMLHVPVGSVFSPSVLPCITAMRRYVKANGIQLIHSYDPSGIFGSIVARLLRLPVITSQLSYRDIMDPKTQIMLRVSDHLAHKVLVNCEAIRKYMIEDQGVSADRVELCYNGVETRLFHPASGPRPKEVSPTALVIGTVCALRTEKGLHLLQEAFAQVRSPHRELQLLIVGSGVELPRLQENAARLGIEDASVFVPAQRNVVDWMRAMDIFVLPSLSEAFSNSLLEAMACGCAVVGSRVGGTPELIGDNTRGLLFEKGNVPDLAAQLRKLIDDKQLRSELAHRAAVHAKENLSIEIAASRTADMYDRLLNSRRS